MGDPRKQRKKYSTPSHPWQAERITKESSLLKEYGLKNKKEIWKCTSILKKFKAQTKDLIRKEGSQAEKEEKQLMEKLMKIGLVASGTKLENILDLNVEDLLKRRLQTLVFKKGLARSAKQSRQFIVHGHIHIGDKKVTIPSYIVPVDEEGKISFRVLSSLSDNDHPERVKAKPKPVEAEKKEDKKETEVKKK